MTSNTNGAIEVHSFSRCVSELLECQNNFEWLAEGEQKIEEMEIAKPILSLKMYKIVN